MSQETEIMPIHTTEIARSDGLDIFCRRFGEVGETPVLIVHGLSYFSYDWIEVANALAVDREVVAIDMRGFGESGWSPTHDYSTPANAGDFINVLDYFGWEKAVLMGHSMGGRHCLYCAAEYPDRTAALILVDSAPSASPKGTNRVAQTIGNMPEVFSTIEEAMVYDPHAPTGASARVRFENFLKPVEGGFSVKRDPVFTANYRKILDTGQRPKPPFDLWQIFSKVKRPVLVVRGTRSDMFTPDIADQVRATVPMAKLVEIDSGHDVAGQNPRALIQTIHTFLSTVSD